MKRFFLISTILTLLVSVAWGALLTTDQKAKMTDHGGWIFTDKAQYPGDSPPNVTDRVAGLGTDGSLTLLDGIYINYGTDSDFYTYWDGSALITTANTTGLTWQIGDATAPTDVDIVLYGGISGITSLTVTWGSIGDVLLYQDQITSCSTVTSTAFTDGVALLTGGSLSSAVSVTAQWYTDGDIVIFDGEIDNADTITSDHFTDGTLTIAGGAVTGALDISGATVTYRAIVNADISATAEIVRSKLALESSAIYGVPLHSVRNVDGTVLSATTGTGSFAVSSHGWGVGPLLLVGETSLNGTVTDTLMFEYILPPEYVADEDVALFVRAVESNAATVSTTLSVQVYESGGQGAVGGNLAAAFSGAGDVTDTWGVFTSVITDGDLTAGDRLIVLIRIVSDNTGEGTILSQPQIGSIGLVLDVRG